MSVALLLTSTRDERSRRMVPVATQATFRARWLPGATQLGLEWVPLMETGFDVTRDNRDELVAELARLRTWMLGALGGGAYELERLDRLVDELRNVQFDEGLDVFLG
jgi:hypothetical protein